MMVVKNVVKARVNTAGSREAGRGRNDALAAELQVAVEHLTQAQAR